MKSYVTMEQNICPVCGTTFDTGNLLMDTHLKDRFENHTVSGYNLCENDQKLFDDGYIALVGIDETKSNAKPGQRKVKNEDAYRTGNLAHLKREIAKELFTGIDLPDELPMIFVEDGVIDYLHRIQEETQNE